MTRQNRRAAADVLTEYKVALGYRADWLAARDHPYKAVRMDEVRTAQQILNIIETTPEDPDDAIDDDP